MTKKLKLPIGILTVLAVFLAALLFLPLGATDGFVVTASAEAVTIMPTKPSGEGTEASPYQIGTANELYWFAGLVNGDSTVCAYNAETNPEGTQQNTAACAILMDNITVNTGVLNPDGTLNTAGSFTDWTPIGNSSNPYTGTFDGQNNTISGLYFNNTSNANGKYVGLFGCIGSDGKVSNVGVVDSYLYGKENVGGVCGNNAGGTIKNCYNTGTVSGSGSCVGGVCGLNDKSGTIENCYNTGAVSGSSNVGGVCGHNADGTIKKCYNTGTVSGTSTYVGGVCGLNNSGNIQNCYNTGAVSGSSSNVGGVCGGNNNTIENCYNTGTVSGRSKVGGVCGSNFGTITNCYYLAGTETDSIDGTTFKTAKQFNSGEVAYLLNGSTSDVDLVWGQKIGQDSYPVFNGDTVYKITPCIGYTNDGSSTSKDHSNFDNGFCSVCGYCQQATKNENGYYEIGNAGQLYWFAALVNGTLTDGTEQNKAAQAKLTADITVNTGVLTDTGALVSDTSGFRIWTPIGNSSNPYTGTFDGQGHIVSGLYYNVYIQYVGLFGYMGKGGKVSNVGVVDSYFDGYEHIGGVCGYNNGTIQNCYNTSTATGDQVVGGVCGTNNYDGKIVNCYNIGAVSATKQFGGICYNNGKVINCYYLDTTTSDSYAISKNEEQFRNGEVACLLSKGCKINTTTYSGDIWGQNIGTDKTPVFGGNTVYQTTPCVSYTNVNSNLEKSHAGYTDNGFCTVCGYYQQATKNENGYYEIGNVGQLYWFAALVNGTLIDGTAQNKAANAILKADITVNKNVLDESGNVASDTTGFRSWTPIGNQSNTYAGTFDGNGYEIKGLYFNITTTNGVYGGLFGYNTGTIKNVCVVDSYFKVKEYVGGVCGWNEGTITNCYNTGTVSGTSSYVGGVCGYNKRIIQNCHNAGKISGTGYYVGGVCGFNNSSGNATITNCYNTGAVSGIGRDEGGVCGENYGTVKNCYYLEGTATGGINGVDKTGSAESRTAAQFASGEVAVLLQGEQTTAVWGQTLTGENKQAYPVLGGTKVYPCTKGCTAKYANTEGATGEHTAPDTYDNGFGKCKDCNADVYQPATLNNGVYEIGNAGQLYWFADKVNNDYDTYKGANAILTADIVVNEGDVSGCNGTWQTGWRDWESIGKTYTNPYKGTFDGNGFYVSGLYFYSSTTDYVGLFGYSEGTIKNVGVVNSYFEGNEHVGGVCGRNGENNYIQNCYNSGTISGKGNFVGGVCGQNYGTITNSYNTGAVSGTTSTSSYIGGVCGSNAYSGTITNCYNTGTVSGKCLYVGGVNGYNYGSIINCYNTGTVSGTDDCVGGVCGENDKTITNCYNTGTVSGKSKTSGGVCGFNKLSSSKIENCYNTGTVSGSSNVCGYNNGAIENCYYLAEAETDSIDGTTFKIAAQFASGEVAYLLQGTQTTAVWGQTLTVENKQAYPVLGGTKVYPCTKGCTAKYANTEGATGEHTAPDTYDKDGFGNCKDCNADVYQPATSIDGVYQISNAGQLYWFAEQVNGGNTTINAELTDNITVNSGLLSSLVTDESGEVTNGGTFRSWTPIGNYSNKYGGIFDGNGKTVSGLYFNGRYTQYVGLFGYSSGTIRNVGVVDSYIRGGHDSGGVCGYNDGGTIKNCYNTGTVKGNVEVGGVCGSNWYGTIANCYNTGTVSGNMEVGDVRGNDFGTTSNCYYLADTADEKGGKTSTQFYSGEVAYLLSQGCTINEIHYSGEVWGQTIGTDDYPVLDSTKKVYLTTPCPSYTNTENETKAHTDENEDGNCDVCNEKFAYIVSLNTMANEGTPSVANPSGGGKFNAGETTTITAEALPGYTFNGWFKGDEATAYCTDLSFEYTPTADVTFTAKYTANAKMTVTINGGTSYSVSVNGGTASDYSTSTSPSYEVGTKLTVTAKGENFAYWQNEAGSVLSRSAEYTFTVVNGATVTAVYNTPVENKAIVNFISGYDQIINRYQITAADDFTVPAAPTKTGCDFAGWSVNGTVVAPASEQTAEQYNEAVKAAVQNAITAALATKEDTTDDIVNVKAEYNNKVQNVTVTVTSGTGGGTYNINAVVTVTANAPESGYKFSHWTDGTNILSYNTSYSFYAAKNIELTAVYVADTVEVEAVGTTEIVDVVKDTTNGKISFVSMSTVPEGCMIVKAGVVATSDSTVGTSGDGFNDTTAAYVRGNSWTGSAYQYSWTKTNASGATWYVRAYLVYTDKNGNTHTMYGKLVTETL